MTRYIYGAVYQPAELQMAMADAARGVPQPTVAKLLQFCYSYDPQGRSYVFSLNRLLGAIMVLALAGFLAALIFVKKDGPK